jgi:predicted enzyme related to lactoylglutathione lyase
MNERNEYLAGVPCWVDLVQADLDVTMAFYGGLFGWTFEIRTPQGAPVRYAYALLDGATVGGVGGPPMGQQPSGWTTYVCVDSADDTVDAVTAAGGQVLSPPTDIPRSGRSALCADPSGAAVGLWQPAENGGAQVVNLPGSWNFSELRTPDRDGAATFYGALFGWVTAPMAMGGDAPTSIWRLPGYGDFLAERDPEIRERQAAGRAPDGFADAVALVVADAGTGSTAAGAQWGIIFAVADADASTARALELGATVVTPLYDTQFTRMGTIRDPQGAELTLSQYKPPTAN